MMTDPPPASRPSVSVVVPFFGDRDAAAKVLAMMRRLELASGDQLILADNTPDGVAREGAGPAIQVVPATGERSSYHARNVGAEAAHGDWLLFVDADCTAPADLVSRYLDRTVPPDVAILAGPVLPARGETGLLREWAATRGILSQESGVFRTPPVAATANMMVRRSAWIAVGGFQEGIRSGGDYEFCSRVAAAGGRLEFRREAGVEHSHRATLRGVVRQMARYSAGNVWQRRRQPALVPRRSRAGELARAVGGAIFFALTIRPRRAALKAVDGVAVAAQIGGSLLRNSVGGRITPDPERLVVATDRFPALSETFVSGEIEALRALGRTVRVEAVARPDRPALGGARGVDVRYLEDESPVSRATALGWVAMRHPLRAIADLRLRGRFAPEERMPLRAIAPLAMRLARGRERHVHVHFAALAHVNAIRAGRVAGVPVSVAPHGHEVFATPRALPEKLRRAAFVAAPCEYTADHLRGVAPEVAGRIGVVVMGVDGDRFRRRRPYPGGQTILAVGRLVEKKGFGHLVEAMAALPEEVRLLIAGEGPLRESLLTRIRTAGVGARVDLLGAVEQPEVRSLLEEADVLAMPSVVAADGDRDAMPVVVKEALAMEVPVVASDEVGLPEVVQAPWGRLVPPADPARLADALSGVLATSPRERARMGVEGRRFVLERFDQRSQARRLLDLLRGHAR